MSGVQMMMAGSGLGRLTGTSASVRNTSVATGVRTGNLIVTSDGTFTATGSSGANWFTPTLAGIGSQWWARATVNSQTTTTISGSLNTWNLINAQISFGFSNTASNNEGTGSLTLAFSPDGGTTTAGSMVCNWDVGYTP